MKTKILIGAALFGAMVLGASLAGFSSAQTPSGEKFSEAEEAEIRIIIREYLAEHPEVIIESVNIYAQREREAEAAKAQAGAKANLGALLNEKNGFVAGVKPASAEVAVIEFFDYHCSFCKRAAGLVLDMTRNDPAVKVVFRDYPILREESEYAAEIALASRAQGKYRDFHFALLGATGVLTPDRIKVIAKKEGLNIAALEAARNDPSIAAAIGETRRIADEIGINGTPGFIIAALDGSYVQVISGYYPNEVAAAIEEAKAAARAR